MSYGPERVSSAALLALTVLACGGSGVAPTAPEPDAIVDGLWRGAISINDATGGGCLGFAFKARKGEEAPVTVDLRQAGTGFVGDLIFGESGNSCDVQGTVGSRTVQFDYLECVETSFRGVPCIVEAARRDIVLFGGRFFGNTVGSGDQIVGTLEISWATFNHHPEAKHLVELRSNVPEVSLDLLVVYDVELSR